MHSGTHSRTSAAALRWLPLALILALLVAFYAAGLHKYLTFDMLEDYREDLVGFVERHAVGAALAYVAVYVAAVAVSFPGASILTIAGGFMFGAFLGTILTVFAATLGATLFFLIARTSLGELLSEKAGPRTQAIREGFQKDGTNYLLFLRLVPVFPFWLVNLAAALFGMRLMPYVLATAAGIVPGTFVYAYLGSGLDAVLTEDGPVVPPSLLVAFALLGVMALVPVLWRRYRRRSA